VKLIYVPRAVAPSVWHVSWADLCGMADRGEQGIAYATGDEGYVLMREGLASDRALDGRALVYFQGWVIAAAPEPPLESAS
jgi:hypothetical protein